MRTIFLIILFHCISNLLHSQDTLYNKDGTKQIIKTLDVNETQVKYKLVINLNGPTYVINKDEVLKIAYETGLIDTFPKKISKNINQDLRNIDFGRNFISLNVSDFLFGFITIGYEYTFKSGKFGLKCPLSFVLNSNWRGVFQNYDLFTNRFSTGFDFYFYLFGKGKAKYFFGPSLEYGQDNFNYQEIVTYYAFSIQNGFLFQLSKHFNFSINTGIGISRSRINNSLSNFGKLEGIVVKGGLNIGYKF